MPLLKLPISVNSRQVLKWAGYTAEQTSTAIQTEVEEVIREAAVLMQPIVYYQAMEISVDLPGGRVWLADNRFFSGHVLAERLAAADKIILALLSLGSAVSEQSRQYFTQGSAWRGLLFDTVGNIALQELHRTLWLQLSAAAIVRNEGVTAGLSPGDNDWPLSDQAVFFQALEPIPFPIVLNDQFVLVPPKSLSVVFGIGKSIVMAPANHDCLSCGRKECNYRTVKI